MNKVAGGVVWTELQRVGYGVFRVGHFYLSNAGDTATEGVILKRDRCRVVYDQVNLEGL